MSTDNWEVDDECDIKLENEIEALESPEYRNMSAPPNVPGLILPTPRSMNRVEQGMMMVTVMETWRNEGNNQM